MIFEHTFATKTRKYLNIDAQPEQQLIESTAREIMYYFMDLEEEFKNINDRKFHIEAGFHESYIKINKRKLTFELKHIPSHRITIIQKVNGSKAHIDHIIAKDDEARSEADETPFSRDLIRRYLIQTFGDSLDLSNIY